MTTQQLTDRDALTDLVSRLGLWLDGELDDDPRTIFTPDVSVSTPGGQAAGLDAVVAQARANHDVPTHHVLANVLPEVDGDRATIRAKLLVTFVGERARPPAPQFAMAGRYRFEAVRDAEGWRLSRIEVAPVWALGERPAA